MPKVSFIMPTHNRDDLIGESIRSIIHQTEKDWELIVVDDHSDPEDRTKQVVNSFNDDRIKYHKLPDLSGRGVSCGRNYGNLLAESELIAVCDSDDIYMPERAKFIKESYEEKRWDVFYGKYLVLGNSTDPYEEKRNQQISFNLEEFKKRDFIPNGSSAYTKNIAMHYPYNSSLNIAEDYDFFSRVAVDGKKFYFCREIIYHYRVHPGAITTGVNPIETADKVREYRGWK